MALANLARWITGRPRGNVFYGVVLYIVPGDQSMQVEIDRAPDSAGSPGTWANITTVGPFAKSGGFYTDVLPASTALYWYRARQVGPGVGAGSYSTLAASTTPRALTVEEWAAQLLATPTFSRTEDINAAAVTPTEVQGRFRVRAKISATQTVVNGTPLTIPFGAEDYDVGSLHDNVTNNSRLTIPIGGNTRPWNIGGWVNIDSVAVGRVFLYLYKNGAEVPGASMIVPAPATLARLLVTFFEDAPAVGDYYELVVAQDSGANRTLQNAYLWAVHQW